MLAEIARLLGRRPPTVELPVAPLFPLAWLAEGWGRITGREPFLTLDSLRMARHRMYYASAKAARELGYRARPYGEALARRDRLVSRARDDPAVTLLLACDRAAASGSG